MLVVVLNSECEYFDVYYCICLSLFLLLFRFSVTLLFSFFVVVFMVRFVFKVRSGTDPAASGDGSDNSNASPPGNKMDMLGLLAQALYILISAAAVGMGSGLLISRLLKTLDTLKSSPVRQVAILMLGGYLSFRCVLTFFIFFLLFCLLYLCFRNAFMFYMLGSSVR